MLELRQLGQGHGLPALAGVEVLHHSGRETAVVVPLSLHSKVPVQAATPRHALQGQGHAVFEQPGAPVNRVPGVL